MELTPFIFVLMVVVPLLLLRGLIRESGGMRIVYGILLILVIIVVLKFPPETQSHAREQARRAVCRSTLHNLALGVLSYQQAHSNAFPKSIQELAETLEEPRLFICKSTRHQPGNLSNVVDWTDYVLLLPPGTNQILGYCPPNNNQNEGGNILFADSSVEWVPVAEFTNVLKTGKK